MRKEFLYFGNSPQASYKDIKENGYGSLLETIIEKARDSNIAPLFFQLISNSKLRSAFTTPFTCISSFCTPG